MNFSTLQYIHALLVEDVKRKTEILAHYRENLKSLRDPGRDAGKPERRRGNDRSRRRGPCPRQERAPGL